MYAQLGTIQFDGLKGFTDLTEELASSIVEHARIDGKPRLQKTGNQLQTLRIGVFLHASFCSPETEYAAMVDACNGGTIMPLLLGNGVYVGDFVLMRLEKTAVQHDPIGNVIAQAISMELKEYYDTDKLQRLGQQAKQNSYATASGGASPLRIITPPRPSLGNTAAVDITAIKVGSSGVDLSVKKAALQPNRWAALSDKINTNLTKIEAASVALQTKIIDPALSPFAGTTAQALLGVYSSVQNMRASLPITDLNTLQNFNNGLQGSTRFLSQSTSSLTGAIATRRV